MKELLTCVGEFKVKLGAILGPVYRCVCPLETRARGKSLNRAGLC